MEKYFLNLEFLDVGSECRGDGFCSSNKGCLK